MGFAGWLGCNAIAGIQDGTLGTLDGGGNDAADVTVNDADGGGAGDAAGDKTNGSDGGLDAMAEAEAGPALASCHIVPNSTVLLDDLSTHDGADLTFAHALGITALSNVGGEAIVVAQTQNENTDFHGYRASYGNPGMPQPALLNGVATKGNIQILQTISDPGGNGNVVLTAYETAFFQQPSFGLQLVPLPNTNNDQFSQGGYELVDLSLTYVNEGFALPTSPTGAYWLASTQGEAISNYTISLGAGFSNDAGAAEQTLALVHTQPNWSVSIAPFQIGSSLYVVANQFSDAGAGVFTVPADLSSTGTQGTINATGTSIVLAAHASVGSPGNALVLAGSITNQGMLQTYAATVAPGMLGSLTIGQAPLNMGQLVDPSQIPFDNGGSVWADDELFAVGNPGDKSGGGTLVWIGPDGHIVSSTATSPGKLIQTSNAVKMCAVAVQDHFGEGRADLVVAWIEQVTPDGGAQPYDQLYSAQVICNPYMPGGG